MLTLDGVEVLPPSVFVDAENHEQTQWNLDWFPRASALDSCKRVPFPAGECCAHDIWLTLPGLPASHLRLPAPRAARRGCITHGVYAA